MSILMIVEAHPLLDLHGFTTFFPRALGLMELSAHLQAYQSPSAPAPMQSDEEVRSAIRQMLRHGGFKPSGRSKPSSEYLIRAVGEDKLASINVAVDICNIVSLHSGLPISVIDLAKAKPPFRIGLAPAGSSYVFNASGQVIDLSGLLCLFDEEGPCGNAVKDAQRTKTDPATTQTLTLIWSSIALPERAFRAEVWYRDLLHQIGATTQGLP